ncbi:hypothetical protein GCM10011571_32740 [Marinithermofilum abyssi]|uniref:Uncharacterized protein n=1 Tax=Marinithermofilum abyssi TaxID=1571185 RepID=A0A8J2VM31_9BACL|nr:hypothetical protein GCM10011571_32740 [Marinithermofilum abyssi]
MAEVRVEMPVRHIEGNLVFSTNQSVWAYYEIDTYDYAYRSEKEQQKMRARWYAVARQLPYESHIVEIPEFPQLESQLRVPQSGPLVEAAKKQREMTMAVLAEHVKEPTDFRVFIGFKVPRVSRMAIKRRIRRTLYHKWYDLRRYIGTISGLRPYDILEEELFDYQDAEELIAQELSSLLVNKPATTRELQWIYRSSVFRGIGEPTLLEEWKPQKQTITVAGDNQAIRPYPNVIRTLIPGAFEVKEHWLRVKVFDEKDGQEKTSYQAFLYVTYMKEDLKFPGQAEWAYWVQRFKFPVSISCRIRSISNEQAMKELTKTKLRLQNQVKYIRTEGQQTDAYTEEKYLKAVDKEAEYRGKEDQPILYMTVCFCVSAPSEKLLHSRVKEVISHYNRRGIKLQASSGDQFLAFNEFLPGCPQYVKDYELAVVPPSLGGAKRGPYQIVSYGIFGEHGVWEEPCHEPDYLPLGINAPSPSHDHRPERGPRPLAGGTALAERAHQCNYPGIQPGRGQRVHGSLYSVPGCPGTDACERLPDSAPGTETGSSLVSRDPRRSPNSARTRRTLYDARTGALENERHSVVQRPAVLHLLSLCSLGIRGGRGPKDP